MGARVCVWELRGAAGGQPSRAGKKHTEGQAAKWAALHTNAIIVGDTERSLVLARGERDEGLELQTGRGGTAEDTRGTVTVLKRDLLWRRDVHWSRPPLNQTLPTLLIYSRSRRHRWQILATRWPLHLYW